jgi:hypothetical protein
MKYLEFIVKKNKLLHRGLLDNEKRFFHNKRALKENLQGAVWEAGNSLLRKILYLSCMSSIQHNDRIRMFYEHLITNNHKKPKVALVACMKKLLIIAHQIYVNKSKYKPLYIDNKNLCFSS